MSTSCGPPGESATATPLYASNAAKFMALYGQTRRRFMAFPRQNPRAPSAYELEAAARGLAVHNLLRKKNVHVCVEINQ